MISIIIPLGSENDIDQYKSILDSTSNLKFNVQLIWVGGSIKVKDWLKENNQFHLDAPNKNRAKRMNTGIEHAIHDTLLLHHPRSILNHCAFLELEEYIKNQKDTLYWGCFTHSFDGTPSPIKSFTSWYSNNIRCDKNKIVYLDHCFFLSKSIYKKITKLPEADIFEDTLLSQELRQISKPKRLNSISLTSDIRFHKNGFFRQVLLNQFTKILFHLGYPLEKINKIYERGLWLN